jgi:hypothetical protein
VIVIGCRPQKVHPSTGPPACNFAGNNVNDLYKEAGIFAEHNASGVVYSKDVSSVFIQAAREIAIAAIAAGRRRGNGLAGRHNIDTGEQRLASRNATAKAGSIGSGSEAGNQQSQKQLTRS